MLVHNIIDISPIYHRYAYRMRYSAGSDIPIMYFVMADVERMREQVEKRGADVVTSACFDSKSFRKTLISSEESTQYKEGRQSILTPQDFEDMETMQGILSEAGVNVFKREGCEADDIIAFMSKDSNSYDMTFIYSPDKDMMANVHGTVGMRREINGIWTTISESTFMDSTMASFKVAIPNNAIGLYLSTVGDSADKVSGIKRFGKKAFENLVNQIGADYDWQALHDYDKVKETLIYCLIKGYLSEEQFKQAVGSYNMVRNIDITTDNIGDEPVVEEDEYGFQKIRIHMDMPSVMKVETVESRVKAYTKAKMPSLAK